MKKQHHEKKKHKLKFDKVSLAAIVIFVAILVIFYGRLSKPKQVDIEKINAIIFDHMPVSFAKDGIIDQDKLEKIQRMDYVELKNALDIKKDFCVYIEDENGNIILEKGSDKLSQDGVYCGNRD